MISSVEMQGKGSIKPNYRHGREQLIRFISKWIPASMKWRDDIPEKTTWFLPTRERCLEDIRGTSELFSSHSFPELYLSAVRKVI